MKGLYIHTFLLFYLFFQVPCVHCLFSTVCWLCLRVDEGSSDLYIGRDGFFFHFFLRRFKFILFPLLNEWQTALSNSEIVKVTRKCCQLLISKSEITEQNSLRIKCLLIQISRIGSIFFYQKSVNHSLFYKFKQLPCHLFLANS